MSQSIGMVSLGCAKNQVDAEQMLFLLQQAGYNILPEPAGADVVIVNTCGFIESAKTEAIDNILAMAQLKAEGSVGKILVTGCLAQRYQEEILKELPEVDGVLGTGSYYDVVSAVKQLLDGAEGIEEYGDIQAPVQECGRILTTPKHYAYLKIAEGCDNHCAFCIIPTLRGKYRSRPMDKLIEEAKELAVSGVKELIVVAQDTSRYGIDLYGERRLAELLREAGVRVKLIEHNAERCRELAERLPDVSVLCADGTRQDFLFSENISQMDAVVALTNLDEENVFICMYARMQGVPQAIPKVNRTEYAAVCQNCGIRSTVSPKDICAQEISRYVRAMESTDAESVLSVYSLLGGRVEALEFLVTADVPHLGESLASVTLQPGILLACISRGAKVIFPGGGDSLQAGDTVIVVAPRERHIAELRQIFAERG